MTGNGAGAHMLAIVLVLMSGGRAVRASFNTCLEEASRPAGDSHPQVAARCDLMKRTLDHCASRLSTDVMSEAWAQDILGQMVRAECEQVNHACEIQFQTFQRDSASYQNALPGYQKELAAYDAWQAEHCPQPAPPSGVGATFVACACWGDCPRRPSDLRMPATPTCSMCDEAAVRTRLTPQAANQAYNVAKKMVADSRRDLDVACQEATLRLSDQENRQRVETGHRARLEAAEARMEAHVSAGEEERLDRQAVMDAAEANANAADDVARLLGPLVAPRNVPFLGIDSAAHRPKRIKYGRVSDAVRDLDPRPSASKENRCEQTRRLLGAMQEEERRIYAAIRDAPASEETSQRQEQQARLERLRRAQQHLKDGSHGCDGN